MKYWLFENGDVIGPFPPEELTGREGFGPHSLVCPEKHGEDDTFWKEAHLYEDFALAQEAGEFAAPVVSDPDKKDVFEEELSTLLEEKSPLISSEDEAAQEEPAENLHFPAHAPSKPGPIEDYFNNIKGEDLGNILGIPDPNENSDMNLARALESQFSQTQPPQKEKEPAALEDDPFDAFTAKEDLADDLTPEDGLAAVAPLTDADAPVVLAEKPEAAKSKPRRKYRIRKKHGAAPEDAAGEEKPGNEAAPQPEATDAETAPVPEETPAAEEPAAEPEAKAPRTRTEDPAPQAVPAEAEPSEPETEELDSIPLSVSDEPLPILLKNPAELKADRQAAERAAEMQLEEETVSLGKTEPSLPPETPAAPAEKEISLEAASSEQSAQQEAVSPAEKEVSLETSAPEKEDPSSAPRPQEEEAPVKNPEPGLPSLPEDGAEPVAQTPQPEAASPKTDDKNVKAAPEEAKDAPAGETPVSAPQPSAVKEPPSAKKTPSRGKDSAPQAKAGKTASGKKNKQMSSGPQTPPAKAQPSVPPVENAAPQEESAPKTEDPVDEIMQGTVRVEDSPEVKEPIKAVESVVAAQVNRVKPTLKKTVEIEQFLTEKVVPLDESPAKSKKVLWVSVVILCFLGLFLLQWRYTRNAAPRAEGQAQAAGLPDGGPGSAPRAVPLTEEAAAVDELMPSAEPEVPSAQEALSLSGAAQPPEISPSERARQIVQNYELPNFNGKVSDYFDRIYKSKLAQGYSATWSAEPLHKNVYIVKYRLSKTRSEPVVYIFQVDVSRNKLIGALNNITLDLVGKIK